MVISVYAEGHIDLITFTSFTYFPLLICRSVPHIIKEKQVRNVILIRLRPYIFQFILKSSKQIRNISNQYKYQVSVFFGKTQNSVC